MLSLSMVWTLLVQNQYIYNILVLILLVMLWHNLISTETVENTKLLFNSYIIYDEITVSVLLIGTLITIWLISLAIPFTSSISSFSVVDSEKKAITEPELVPVLSSSNKKNRKTLLSSPRNTFNNNITQYRNYRTNVPLPTAAFSLFYNLSQSWKERKKWVVKKLHIIKDLFIVQGIYVNKHSEYDKTLLISSKEIKRDIEANLSFTFLPVVETKKRYALWLYRQDIAGRTLKAGLNIVISNEFLSLIFLLVIAMGALSTTNSFLTLFVGIELQSLTLYILLASNVSKSDLVNKTLNLNQNKLSKVSLSYLINAATATALLLLGFSIESNILILIAILWKLGVMPLHAWSLPILDNQHSLVISIYLTITKYGNLLVIGLIASQSILAVEILIYVGLLNLTMGNILGLLQYRYQRIIVFSSLIQIGYMLLILGNYSSLGLGYFELYSFFTVMLLILWIIPTYNKLNANNLLPSVQLWTLILTLYTVAGLPFFPLFWTKLDVLLTIQSESLIIALVSTLLSSLIYVRLIKYMSFFKC